MAESHVEQRVDQVKKYVEQNKGWRPSRRTMGYLAAMLVALVLAAIFIPKLLPGSIRMSESLLGRKGGIDVVPLGGSAARQFIPAPTATEGYSAWALSDSREEVLVGWYHALEGKVDKVSVQSRSAYSGRLQVEWSVEVKDNNSRVAQLGFIPRHNQIWFLADGHVHEIDIKSSQILDFPFKGPEGKGEVKAPTMATCVAFSPVTGKLAYAQRGVITIVTGLASARNEKALQSREVMVPGVTKDAAGKVVSGDVQGFTWVGDDILAVLLAHQVGQSVATPIYFITVGENSVGVEPKVQTPAPGVFKGISHAPTGTDFAVLYSADPNSSSKTPGQDAIYLYASSGGLTKKVGLPGGPWRLPLSWGP
ncbi:MAG: hypothetical protein ACYC99_08440 [Candidatus Geothermincolia bacterium]